MSSVAIITARGGSKRIPRKNIRDFHGKPILAYSIEAAIKAGVFAEVMVSTDDDEIAKIAESAGAKVPFRRSGKNSDDFATTADVLGEVLDGYEAAGKKFGRFCCIYPTAPFVTAEKLENAMALLAAGSAQSVIPVVKFGFPIQRALQIEGGLLSMVQPENMFKRSQDLPARYHDAGQFYCCDTAAFRQAKSLFCGKTAPLVVPESEVQDIDTEEDWKIAELKFALLRNSAGKREG